jgi:hypothetical protein
MSDITLPIPDWFNPKEILTQYVEGKRSEDIAASIGTTPERLGYYLRTRAPKDWQEAQVIRDIRRKEEAEDAIDNAKDMLELNKAQAKLKSAQWSLERVCRRIYGEVKEQTAERPVQINIHLRRKGDPEPRVIEQEA